MVSDDITFANYVSRHFPQEKWLLLEKIGRLHRYRQPPADRTFPALASLDMHSCSLPHRRQQVLPLHLQKQQQKRPKWKRSENQKAQEENQEAQEEYLVECPELLGHF
ncbi:uncharacterized protein LOC131383696 [Hylobates moloch]|uniref:uncharacterized protein LOC131383696 n=1 Tax=Hylobates moloch TaxID=81572 RepID=UPI00267474C5|nr:uncharacterized protein LOC131383696 [Hylobates moloch]